MYSLDRCAPYQYDLSFSLSHLFAIFDIKEQAVLLLPISKVNMYL